MDITFCLLHWQFLKLIMPSVIGLLISFLCGFGLSEDYKTKSIKNKIKKKVYINWNASKLNTSEFWKTYKNKETNRLRQKYLQKFLSDQGFMYSEVSEVNLLSRLFATPWQPCSSPGQNTGLGSLSLLQGSSQPRDWTQVSCIAGGFFTSWATREAQEYIQNTYKKTVATQ